MAKAGCKPTHGLSYSPEYRAWIYAKSRCYNSNKNSFKNYGQRGIEMSPEWRDNPAKFIADMGPRPSSMHTLERLDNSGPYCKENCVWATRETQANNRRTNRLIMHNGECLTAAQWGKRIGGSRYLVSVRIYMGWPEHLAISVPAKKSHG
jgi:hypothetical protein